MEFIHSNIGSAKDNAKSAIHNWYKFTAGFSYRFVDEIINFEGLNAESKVFEPFAGCGTTLVSCQKNGVLAVGNEGQEFMYDVIQAKLYWELDKESFEKELAAIKNSVIVSKDNFDIDNAHQLLKGLYSEESLAILYLIKDAISEIKSNEYRLFFKLALSQTLHKVSIHPVAVPYISRSKTLSNTDKAWEFFESISNKMFTDTEQYKEISRTSEIYLHDSRIKNKNIADDSCSICITSPPYLNNLDYGEVSKVHTHFYNITDNWNDITNNVRKKLVTGSTTHYREIDFKLENFKKSEFFIKNKETGDFLIEKANEMALISVERAGKKSFNILTLLYFQDMYQVLKEIRRVVKKDGKAYLILGDSAPYGVFIPTTEKLGEIAKSVGFSNYQIQKIRTRGTKWKTLKNRHSLELSENVLILQ
jgi:DNA modification methylase